MLMVRSELAIRCPRRASYFGVDANDTGAEGQRTWTVTVVSCRLRQGLRLAFEAGRTRPSQGLEFWGRKAPSIKKQQNPYSVWQSPYSVAIVATVLTVLLAVEVY